MPDLSIQLQLMIGANVPLPAPYEVMSAVVQVEVTNKDRERDGFQLALTIGKESPLDYGLLRSGLFNPPNRIIISVIINALPQVLIDGIITNQQMTPSNQPGESRLTITGEDISLKLDLKEVSDTHPNQPDSVIVNKILMNYPTLGLIPKVTPTTDVPLETDRVPSQQCTDLEYIRELAQNNGFVFYIEPTLPTLNTAYWGMENRLGTPQPALSMNMGPDTNVDSPINFTYNALGPASPQVTIVEPNTRLPITIPVPSGLRPPLARQPISSLRTTVNRSSANLNPIQAGLRALATASETSSDAVVATGEIDALRYGRALRSRRLVGVRGVGDSFNGFYYVKEVRHSIRVGQYTQSFTLTREGVGALSPVVVP